ncbi:MAG: hypothetical protein ACQKBW_12730 [Puniceicoccales bacterium]
MISWIQTIIQRHHKWFFGALLIVIIVAFVFTVGAVPGIGSPNRSEYTRDFLGFNLSSDQVQQNLARGVEMSYILSGRNPQSVNLEDAMKQRAVMLYLANTLEIPSPGEKQVAQYIQSLPAFTDPQTGQFSNNVYTTFLDNVSNSSRYSEQVVADIIAQDWRIQRAAEAVSGPGYVLSYLAEQQEAQARTSWSVETAVMSSEGFQTVVDVKDDELQTYFEQAGERYKLPAQMTLNYVFFPAKDYAAKVPEPTEEQLEAYYIRNISQWEKTEDGAAKPFEDVRDAVAKAWRQPQAVNMATEAASQLTVDIYKAYTAKKIASGEQALLDFVKNGGYTVKATPAFGGQELPKDFPLPLKAVQAGASLKDRRLYSDAIPGPEGAYVVFRGELIPAKMPKLEDVRESVVADYKTAKTSEAFTAFGEKIHNELQQTVDKGDSFTAVARKNGFEVKSYEDFTLMSPPKDLPQYYFYSFMDMDQGQVSPMLRVGPESVFIYVKKKETPDVTSDPDALKEATDTIGYYFAGATAQSIIRDLVAVGDKMATPEEF